MEEIDYFCGMNDIIRETFHSVGSNEHRTIVFAIDSQSFMECKRVLFLNSFLKKSTKQYKGEIETARQIMNKYIGGQEDDED